MDKVGVALATQIFGLGLKSPLKASQSVCSQSFQVKDYGYFTAN